ncbi:MAG: flagellar export protein FliJ [Desulfovibrionaceae bacterium]|nr:flagellar export protein FliJ [Desulfovibrionaceae bacterium]
MAPFRFRLEQVRLYRKQLEERAMQALAQAVAHRDALKEHIAALQQALVEQHARLSRAEDLEAAERWLIQNYASGLKEDLRNARIALEEAEDAVDQCRADLVQKAKERGLLDTLKEKQAAKHLQLERQQEQRTYDETATLRYKPAAV